MFVGLAWVALVGWMFDLLVDRVVLRRINWRG
jgi:hypothetical protein